MFNLKEKMKSDRGASLSTEQVLYIALAVFVVLAVSKFIIKPLTESAEGIGLEIEAMDPRN